MKNKPKALSQKDIYTSMFIVALFTIAKMWKQARDEWIKMWYMYTMEYYSATKQHKILPFVIT